MIDQQPSHREEERLHSTLRALPPEAVTGLEVGFGDFRVTDRLRQKLDLVSAICLDRRICAGVQDTNPDTSLREEQRRWRGSLRSRPADGTTSVGVGFRDFRLTGLLRM